MNGMNLASASEQKRFSGAITGAGNVSYSEPKCATTEPSEVQREMRDLERAGDRLHSCLKELLDRLVPVSDPAPCGNDACAEPVPGSPLGKAIREQRDVVLNAADRIRDAIRSLAI